MPNIDGGHYFLTVLAPILMSDEVAADGAIECPSNSLRRLLALMPATGGPDPTLVGSATEGPLISPFARNQLNHFARFAVIADVNYNGRINGDGLVETVRGTNPALPQPMDRLSRPYLLFAAEFDPNPDGAPEPDVYLDRLWATMEPELRAIFGHCYRFAEVQGAGDFVRYIKRCQIETTLPFNDYWTEPPPLKAMALALAPALVAAAVSGGIAGLAVARLIRPVLGAVIEWALVIPAILMVATLVLLFAVRRHAARPFPTAPDSDLPSILKALYLQNALVDFAIAHQGDPPDALNATFGDFLAQHRPSAAAPTQPPAVVGA